MSKKRKNLKKGSSSMKSGVFELRPGNMLYASCVNAGGHLYSLGDNKLNRYRICKVRT